MCASRSSEHTSITTYRSQSFRCPSDLRIATLLTTPNAVGAVLWCTHPNAICIPNRTGSSAETLDMDNPENLEILKILVQTDAVRFGVPFCICLLFSYHAPFSLHTVRVCHCCTCVRERLSPMSDVANQRHTTITRKLAILTYAIGAFPLFTNNEFNASAST